MSIKRRNCGTQDYRLVTYKNLSLFYGRRVRTNLKKKIKYISRLYDNYYDNRRTYVTLSLIFILHIDTRNERNWVLACCYHASKFDNVRERARLKNNRTGRWWRDVRSTIESVLSALFAAFHSTWRERNFDFAALTNVPIKCTILPGVGGGVNVALLSTAAEIVYLERFFPNSSRPAAKRLQRTNRFVIVTSSGYAQFARFRELTVVRRFT